MSLTMQTTKASGFSFEAYCNTVGTYTVDWGDNSTPSVFTDVSNFTATHDYADTTLKTITVDVGTALTQLNCYSNQLTSLDVSLNTALTQLSCSDNQLTSLDVSLNTALITLYCYSNQLTSLDVSLNTALITLYCSSNQLTSLDVSLNTALITLYCYSNQLTSLDVSLNTALLYLECSNNQLTSLSLNTALTILNCYSNQLTSLDVSLNTALITLNCSSNQLTSLDVSLNTALITLNCYSNQLTSLDVSLNTALLYLECSNNQLTSLSLNTALTQLSCYNNQLTSLSLNTALTILNCYSNQLTSLDVSLNTALITLNCYSNQLTSLDVSLNTALTQLSCSGNQLTSLDVSLNTTLLYLECSNSQLTSLSLNTALITLYCYSNQLTSLDVSLNTALTILDCSNNQLTSLSLNTALVRLYCDDNEFSSTSVDVILADILANNLSNGYLFIYNNADPTSNGIASKNALQALGWVVLVNTDVSTNTFPFMDTFEGTGSDILWASVGSNTGMNFDASIPDGVTGWGNQCLDFGNDWTELYTQYTEVSALYLSFDFVIKPDGYLDVYFGDTNGDLYYGYNLIGEIYNVGTDLTLFISINDTNINHTHVAISYDTKHTVSIQCDQITGYYKWCLDNVTIKEGSFPSTSYKFGQITLTGYDIYADNIYAENRPSTLLDGLVAHWKMDEENGTRVDSVGDLDLEEDGGSVFSAVGKIEKAVSANGSANALIKWIENYGRWTDDLYTFTVWVYVPNVGIGYADTTLELSPLKFIIFCDPTETGYHIQVTHTTNNHPIDIAVVPGWHLLKVSGSCISKTIDIQVDLESIISNTFSDIVIPSVDFFAQIGQYQQYSDAILVDSLSIWNRVLTPEERNNLYNCGRGLDYPFNIDLTTNLVAHWKMDEESGTRYDSVGTRHLLETNGLDYSPAVPGSLLGVSGKLGKCILFTDNTENPIILRNSNMDLIELSAISICGWVKVNPITSFNDAYLNIFESGGIHIGVWASDSDNYYLTTKVNIQIQTMNWIFFYFESDQSLSGSSVNNGSIVADSNCGLVLESLIVGNQGFLNNVDSHYVDSLSIWNRVLTPEERTALYNNGAGLDYPFTQGADPNIGRRIPFLIAFRV